MERNIYKIGKELFITSDEEIKEDYVISTYDKWKGDGNLKPQIGKILEIHEDYYLIDSFNGDNDNKWDKGHSLKIILTTDPDLIADGVQAIDDEFLEWFVKNPSCEWVEIKLQHQYHTSKEYYIDAGYVDCTKEQYNSIKSEIPTCPLRILYKIIIPQEEPKQETLEEAAEKYTKDGTKHYMEKTNVELGFIEGAKWQAERMYSEEDMFEFSQWISHEDWVYLRSKGYWVNEEQEELEQKLSSKEILNLWFEQFKKKQ